MPSQPTGLEPFARRCIAFGAAFMLAGVILGAFGTHLLEARLTARQFSSYQTAVLYQLMHALGLVVVGLVAQAAGTARPLRWSARLMLFGIVCFPGSIYLMTAGAPRWLGMAAPVGGLAFMASWALLAWHALALNGRHSPPSG
jgi:uncharacterized membrane protein YgdD (TMEM256/DUF423 family)